MIYLYILHRFTAVPRNTYKHFIMRKFHQFAIDIFVNILEYNFTHVRSILNEGSLQYGNIQFYIDRYLTCINVYTTEIYTYYTNVRRR